ncbi:hypothetical protein BDZ45DRAFT_743418 [Acephala macrosclerotiorum]|nr:hypothetical protein BDZ45DRAFT_743418 [Acephala macrosclerotiorum]
MATFHHSPLDPAQSEIRLLKLFPCTGFDADIRLELFHASLHSAPEYLPLSYTWGAPYEGLLSEWDDINHTCTITVSGAPFQIRMNLESALRHIRKCQPHETVLWIDAICINQDDVAERSS